MPRMTEQDLANIRAAIQLRDKAVNLAVRNMEHVELPRAKEYARITFDAAVGLIRADERRRTRDEVMARLRALEDWMRDSGCGLGGEQIIALVEDPRSVDVLVAAAKRTKHRIGCDCNRCTDGGEG